MRAVSVGCAVAASVLAVVGVLGAFWVYRCRKHTRNQPPEQWQEVASVKKIHLYPLKSGKRLEVQSAECTRFGLKQNNKYEKAMQLHDRSFVIVGKGNNEFKTARTFPKMVLIEVAVHDDTHVKFEAPHMRPLYVRTPKEENVQPSKITLHLNERIFALDCGDEAAIWCSQYIYGKDTGLRLAFHDAKLKHQRDITKTHQEMMNVYNHLPSSTGLYSDLTAVMLMNQASVDDLNAKIESDTTITSEHFRPTIIVSGAPAFAEDHWKWIKIGDSVIRNIRPCTRCIMTTIDPEMGTRNTNREPLNTLLKYRQLKDVLNIDYEGELGVMGIMNSVVKEGEINVGDKVYVGA